MEFQITKQRVGKIAQIAPNARGVTLAGYTDAFTWALVKADESVVAKGPYVFDTEKAARSQIAEAKKAMKGAMRCKVVTLDAGTSL